MIYQILQEVTTSVAILTGLTAVIIFYIFQRNKSSKTKIVPPEVKNERIFAFQPKPLIDEALIRALDGETLEVAQPDEQSPNCLNLAKVNYLDLLNNETLKTTAIEAIKKYGVGSCGPRGFYGTIDVHLRLESEIAKFMDMEEAVLYSYGFSTIASAIGAYCKKSDIIFADEMISFSSKQGFIAAKSTIVYFKHNDVDDLEKKLKEYEEKEAKRKKMYRKFLIIEGIYGLTGTICPLPELMKLREKYHLRMFLDETISFGVLGKTGRGISEHFNVDRSEIDMIMGSLEAAVGSIGGFCVGASVIIEHQRLSGLGYCFSASLPPCLSDIACQALQMFEQDPGMFELLRKKSTEMHEALEKLTKFKLLSDPISPLKVITTKDNQSSVDTIHDYCTNQNLHLIKENNNLYLNVNVAMDSDVINRVASILQSASNSI